MVACTAGAMRGDQERALEAGCDAYLSKPIDTREFSQLVGRLLPGDCAKPDPRAPASRAASPAGLPRRM